MFSTKIALVVRADLETWKKLNVTAFLVSGVIGKNPHLIGKPYKDRDGHTYNSLSIQPMIVLSADSELMGTIHRRALERDVQTSLYVEEMFSTGDDHSNRAVFAKFAPDDANVVGIGMWEDKKIVDKITKGARLHA